MTSRITGYDGERGSKRAPERPELEHLLAKAAARYEAMTPEQREVHDKAQRESWVRGMMRTGDPRFD